MAGVCQEVEHCVEIQLRLEVGNWVADAFALLFGQLYPLIY